MSPRVSAEYKAKKKSELLHAAKRVFIRKGYSQATMQDIMDEAGVSRGALYAYFENIEHAYLELLQHEDREDLHFFDAGDAGTSWQQMKRWVAKQQKVIEHMDESLFLANSEFFLSVRRRAEHDGVPYLSNRYSEIVAALAAFFQRGTDRGEWKPRLPEEAIARYLVSFMDGLMIDTAHLGPDRTKVKEQLETLLFSLEEMLYPANDEQVKFGKGE